MIVGDKHVSVVALDIHDGDGEVSRTLNLTSWIRRRSQESEKPVKAAPEISLAP